MNTLKRIALALVIIGAINWGLIGFFRFDLVASIFGGQDALLARIVYGLVGLSGLYCLTILFDPMDEKNTSRDDFAKKRNLNYGTEFGEDKDFSSIKKTDKDV
ncbi:DUF378 domain-containing protein [Oceanobacillus chungangensis]|uniref:DUF378 domain-containing protein n=1 Tax=Oceanobacillus chungangensis TaxID=1229152 RepID=A0A3D8PIS2_9BACI|nr:DUF378 domain-containing protein [Oceanobacillus chungangensis]RDW15990.1 DUF378 domain-containing protein [Oceanobacillus chungangensis]